MLAALAATLALSAAVAARAQPLLQAAADAERDDAHHDHRAGQIFVETSVAAGGAEQLTVAYGATPDAASFSWLTNATGAQSLVRWGLAPGQLDRSATGAPGKAYTCAPYTSGLVHVVNVTGLPLATTIYYRVGDDASGASDERSFVSSPGAAASYPYTFGIVGDPGQTSNSNATFQHLLASKTVDSVFVPGDLSYADGDQPRWDSFQRLVDPLASTKPFMVASGNHASIRSPQRVPRRRMRTLTVRVTAPYDARAR